MHGIHFLCYLIPAKLLIHPLPAIFPYGGEIHGANLPDRRSQGGGIPLPHRPQFRHPTSAHYGRLRLTITDKAARLVSPPARNSCRRDFGLKLTEVRVGQRYFRNPPQGVPRDYWGHSWHLTIAIGLQLVSDPSAKTSIALNIQASSENLST